MHETRTPGRRELWQVVLLGAFGYYIIGIVLVLQVLLTAVGLKHAVYGTGVLERVIGAGAAVFLFFGVYHLFRAFFVHMGRMEGYRLPDDAPMYAEMHALAAKLAAPAPRDIYVTEEFNASAGVHRTCLPSRQASFVTIGLPLAAALTADELRAVLAHELGHHSRRHSRISNWVYRVRASWYGVDAAYNSLPGISRGFVEQFYEWYIPLFQRKSFAVARANEYEADAAAAAATSGVALASSLCRLEAVSGWLNWAYWPAVHARIDHQPRPPANVMKHMTKALGRLQPGAYARFLSASAEEQTDEHDTHPALPDRLAALGQSIDCPPATDGSALAMFGDYLDEIQAHVSREWAEDAAEDWAERHEDRLAARDRLSGLQTKAAGREPEIWERLEAAELHEELDELEPALRHYHAIWKQRRLPLDLAHCARLMLALKGQTERVEQLARKACGICPLADTVALPILARFTEDPQEQKRLRQRWLCAEHATQERGDLYIEDDDGLGISPDPVKPLLPHALSATELERFRSAVANCGGVDGAVVVRVALDEDDSYPHRADHAVILELSRELEDDEWDELYRRCWVDSGTFALYDQSENMRAYLAAADVHGTRLFTRSTEAAEPVSVFAED